MKRWFMLLAGFLCLGWGCAINRGDRMELTTDRGQVKRVLRAQVPTGMAVAAARTIMERNGFRCRMRNDESFSENGIVVNGIDFLYCDREQGMPVATRWQVALVSEEGRVADILVSVGLTGP